ncbi:2-oxoglutarate dehydrogenase E1 component [Cytobacillus sp. IB215665]|uniref:2-oxoglutarate dehydrogenase E1 component n=1 Tax=Cytobacillus sp. IB215665 TaxID=3097357 RepID=UPI002A16DF31|nr:2-oxoglutarate dehydrogenase E1 component [Cytobacillus sp. IB215665]MDX8365730.1 2-oxoglutarate dehydrogenase E1 component [Cytobacillus sp. IB215665]
MTNRKHGFQWQSFSGPNIAYVQEQYELYCINPNQVDDSIKQLFAKWGPPTFSTPKHCESQNNQSDQLSKVASAIQLITMIRTKGHLYAKINPLHQHLNENASSPNFLNLETYQLTENDLNNMTADIIWEHAPHSIRTGFSTIEKLKELYTSSLSYEFNHVQDLEERAWLYKVVEAESLYEELPQEQKVSLLERLIEVESFEMFLHKTFAAQKRFSIEGLDMLVPMLDEIIYANAKTGTKDMLIGMAHRGRLNVLAHVLRKPYEKIFSEFHHAPNKHLVPSEGSTGINYGWTGDVKYHLGADLDIHEQESIHTKIHLANNPSHLEFVNPVVQGFTRAAQENRQKRGFPIQNQSSALSILIHGDAAFPGEGIVAESLNLSRLRGYQTGGTIHIIANNQIGFTTSPVDSRSTLYASDIVKGFEIPIIHVNADDPEACLVAVRLASQYREKFKKDFLIDLVGYRRYGHNETDDPMATQPLTYNLIHKHTRVAEKYAEQLYEKGQFSVERYNNYRQFMNNKLTESYKQITTQENTNDKTSLNERLSSNVSEQKTPITEKELFDINTSLVEWPEDLNVYPKLKKILMRRKEALKEQGKVDWGLAEALALASIISDGTPIRMTGQDIERGTFAHRHIVINDFQTDRKFSALHNMDNSKASFAVYNSPLSEAAVLGFEYGYSVYAPDTLVIWEAQFGDFVNAAQVIIDQFISAGRAKWGQKSGLVMLLPHGYEGQGPEHSSARLERFLTLSAENNWTVANVTSSAQYFLILKRQAAMLSDGGVRPLIIMTPKSLLRHTKAMSYIEEFTNQQFQEVIEHPLVEEDHETVTRLILCTGKIAVDIVSELETRSTKASSYIHILRIEQLYPFPKEEIIQIIQRFPNLADVFWVQEEPKNMGAWEFIYKLLQPSLQHVKFDYIGRPYHSSPATGEHVIHKVEQEQIIQQALKITEEWA